MDNTIRMARQMLRDGAKRDDVYHYVVKSAARLKFDRYEAWLNVVTEVR